MIPTTRPDPDERVNILLVDDQPGKLMSYEVVLAELGENLLKATSGKEALKLLLRHDIAVVLVDVCMPEMDGFDLASLIREHPRFRDTAIILVSGVHISEIDRLKGYDSGAVDYLPVPIVPELLRAKVRVFADLYRKTRQLNQMNRMLEQRIEERTAELRRSNEDLQQFAYVASHDLQEPLRMISSFVQLLAKRYENKLDQDAKDFIGFAVNGARRMHDLINDLLAYSRVDTAGTAFAPVDTRQTVARALDNLRLAIRESGAIVTQGDLPVVRCDEIQIVQVLQNLVGNAIKFRRNTAVPEIHIEAVQQGNEWRFSVRDNGIGIETPYAERIFQVFQRLHARNEYPGTGIGLAICKKIVERHRGRIWVESAVSSGSTFHFTLPGEVEPTQDDSAADSEGGELEELARPEPITNANPSLSRP
jgi:two-component system sensor histidine kinase/response regulator